MDPTASAHVQEIVRRQLKTVQPRPRNWYADTHAALRVDLLVPLSRCLQNPDTGDPFPIVVGLPGSPLERISQVLADSLNREDTLRTGTKIYKKVFQLDLLGVRGDADVPAEEQRIPNEVLIAALQKSTEESAILVLEHAQTLDAQDPVSIGMLAALRDVGEALVVAIYRQRSGESISPFGILSLAQPPEYKAEEVLSAESTVKETRKVIQERFAPKWSWADHSAFECDAFETAYALSPWLGTTRQHKGGLSAGAGGAGVLQESHGARFALPYFAIFLGRDVIAENTFGGASEFRERAAIAQVALQAMRLEARGKALEQRLRDVFNDLEADLNAIVANPEPRIVDSMRVFTRGHVACRLLGAGHYTFDPSLAAPDTAVTYEPDQSRNCSDFIGSRTRGS